MINSIQERRLNNNFIAELIFRFLHLLIVVFVRLNYVDFQNVVWIFKSSLITRTTYVYVFYTVPISTCTLPIAYEQNSSLNLI